MTLILNAHSRDQLRPALQLIDTTVPLRTEGRTTKHTEIYAIVKCLSAMVNDCLTYPLTLAHRDRPDFLLTIGSVQIGIEHTEAISENEAHRSALREHGHGEAVQFISRTLPGEPKKSRTELINELKLNKSGDGWVGDSVEREWAAAMLHSVHNKIDRLNSAGFERFSQNWLLIYDNWSLPVLHEKEGVEILHKSLLETDDFSNYDHIFILCDQWLCELKNNKITFRMTNDL